MYYVYCRHHAALERTLFLDHVPSDQHMELWEINCKVHRRGLELIKPGVRCGDIAHELNEIYREHDLLNYRSSAHARVLFTFLFQTIDNLIKLPICGPTS